MFCPYCGKEIPDGAKFCGLCGQKLRPAGTQLQNTQQNSMQPRNARQACPQSGGKVQRGQGTDFQPGAGARNTSGRQPKQPSFGTRSTFGLQPDNAKKKLIILGVIAGVLVFAAGIAVVPFAVPLKADSYQEQIDLGEQYLAAEDYEQAIVAYTAAIEIDDQQTDAYMARAEAYIALAVGESSKDFYETAEDAAESTAAAGEEESGEIAEEAEGETAETEDTDEGTEGDVAEETGAETAEENLDKALADYRTVIGLEPKRTEAYICAADIYTVYRADYESAEEILREGLAANPDDEDLTEALEEVEKLIEEAQEDAAEELTAEQVLSDYAQQYTYLAGNSYDVTYEGENVVSADGISDECEYRYNYEDIPNNPLTYQIYDYDGDGQEELLIIFTEISEEHFDYSAIGGSNTADVCIYEVIEDGSVEKAADYEVASGIMSMFEYGFVDWFLYEAGDVVYIGMEMHDGVYYFGDGYGMELTILRYENGGLTEVASYPNSASAADGETAELSFDDTVVTFDPLTVFSGEKVCQNDMDAAVFCESVSEDVNPSWEKIMEGDVLFTVTFTDENASADDAAAEDLYLIGEDGWVLEASGTYTEVDFSEEKLANGTLEYAYQWDGEDVSETEYYSKLAQYYDSSEAAGSCEWLTLAELYETLYSTARG